MSLCTEKGVGVSHYTVSKCGLSSLRRTLCLSLALWLWVIPEDHSRNPSLNLSPRGHVSLWWSQVIALQPGRCGNGFHDILTFHVYYSQIYSILISTLYKFTQALRMTKYCLQSRLVMGSGASIWLPARILEWLINEATWGHLLQVS